MSGCDFSFSERVAGLAVPVSILMLVIHKQIALSQKKNFGCIRKKC